VGPRAALDAETRKKKSSASVEDRTPVFQFVVRHYTDWATPAPTNVNTKSNILKYVFGGGIRKEL
jgi:hypothetical protein